MTCFIADLADAIVTSLNDESMSQEFTAVRKWVVKWTMPELATLRVTVVPGPATYAMVGRGEDDQTHEIDIGIQQKIDPDTNTPVDALVALMEEIVEHCRALTLTPGTHTVKCVKRMLIPGAEAAVAPEHLNDKRTFTSVIRTTWMVLG